MSLCDSIRVSMGEMSVTYNHPLYILISCKGAVLHSVELVFGPLAVLHSVELALGQLAVLHRE